MTSTTLTLVRTAPSGARLAALLGLVGLSGILALASSCAPAGFEQKIYSRNRAVATAIVHGNYLADRNALSLRIAPRALLPPAVVRPGGRWYRIWVRPSPAAPWRLVGVLDPEAPFGPFEVPGRKVELWITAEATPLAMGPTMDPIFARVIRAP